MMRLVTVEIQRLLARRMTRLLAVLAVLGVVVAGIVMLVRADPNLQLTDLKGILLGTTVPVVLVGWLVGASFIGAEWRAGTVATVLTWEPRRHRVFGAKIAAAVLVATAGAILLQTLIALGLLPAVFLKGTTSGADMTWLRGLVGVVLRGAALTGMAAAIGFSVGSLGRNTSLAVGAGFVYVVILEGGLLHAIFPGLDPWLLVPNSFAFMTGESLGPTVRSMLEAGVTLAVYTALLALIALGAFKARDIT